MITDSHRQCNIPASVSSDCSQALPVDNWTTVYLLDNAIYQPQCPQTAHKHSQWTTGRQSTYCQLIQSSDDTTSRLKTQRENAVNERQQQLTTSWKSSMVNCGKPSVMRSSLLVSIRARNLHSIHDVTLLLSLNNRTNNGPFSSSYLMIIVSFTDIRLASPIIQTEMN